MTINKLASILLAAAVGATTSGCIISEGNGNVPPPDDVPYTPYYTAIDADYVLNTDLGYGAGLFVEYGSGGDWQLWTSCDTKATGLTCDYEVHVKAGADIINLEQLELESGDQVDVLNDNSLSFFATTGTRSDAIRFTTEPGADVEVELVLDGVIAPLYLVWYSDGLVHDGADGSPVIFQPSAP